jgi:hypothetical protein
MWQRREKVVKPLFLATRPFGPADGSRWDDYVRWSGLSHIEELVSLDQTLCPKLLDKFEDRYWPHLVKENDMLCFFDDPAFVIAETEHLEKRNILCVYFAPLSSPQPPTTPISFQLLGYDLLDRASHISALSNCGGFPNEFEDAELTRHGLLPDFDRARKVQELLRTRHPGEFHAQCNLWAICRNSGADRPQ